MIETEAFAEMTAHTKEQHKSVHGLRGWKESSKKWEAFLGKRTWEKVHEDDHANNPKDYAHRHRVEIPSAG